MSIEPTQECLDGNIDRKLSMGGINAFYFHCDTYQGRSNYAVCQHTIDAVLEERVQLRSGCVDMIRNGTCPALAMRKREEEAGKALFFIDRREQLARFAEASAKSSELVRYGKSRAGNPMPRGRQVSMEEAGRFKEELRKKQAAATEAARRATPTPKVDDGSFNPDLAGGNLLGDAIQKMMEESSK